MIEMTKNFSLNGNTLEKGKKLKIKKGFSLKGDVDQKVANTLVERGVAKVVSDEPVEQKKELKDEPKPKSTDNKQGKK